jgi:carboxyl-terminal processing protease
MRKFSTVMEQVRMHYVDAEKVTYENLVEGALDGMLKQLDPHSGYLSAKKHEDLQNDTRQQFGGIGVVISIRNDTLTVIDVMEDGPSEKAGLLAGDRIVKIGDRPTKGFNTGNAAELLRGTPGTDAQITVHRGKDTEKEFKLTRAIIKTKTVRDLRGKSEFPLLEKPIGYLRISSFSSKTANELEVALVKMEKAGMKGLVLDLRDNPGGLLQQSSLVAEKFLKAGQLVVSTEGRNGRVQEKLVASAANHRMLPIVVLVNQGSASASEIVAGCLQDLKRAEIVGVKTFGKGSVQSIRPLRDGSAIRITTAKYYTPSHRTIHGKGIEPDHVVEMTPEQMRNVMLQRSPVGLEGFAKEEQKKIREAKDLQLDKALELLRTKFKQG